MAVQDNDRDVCNVCNMLLHLMAGQTECGLMQRAAGQAHHGLPYSNHVTCSTVTKVDVEGQSRLTGCDYLHSMTDFLGGHLWMALCH